MGREARKFEKKEEGKEQCFGYKKRKENAKNEGKYIEK